MRLKNFYKQGVKITLMITSFFSVTDVLAASLSGVVIGELGLPVAGAMVTVIDKSEKHLITRYTNTEGRYTFENIKKDTESVRARLIGYQDLVVPFDNKVKINFNLNTAGEAEVLQQLPAHVWAERVALNNDSIRREFRVQCMMCHQQGNSIARWPKSKEQWFSVFDRMAHKKALLTNTARDEIVDALLTAYDTTGDLGIPRIPDAAQGEALKAEITEWRLNSNIASMHDVAVGPDGKIYGADTQEDNIWRLDPETGITESLNHLRPLNRGDAKTKLHTVFQAPDGKMWFTYASGNLVASLNVYTEEMKVYEMSYLDGIYPHTIRFDQDGQIWFTVTLSNQLGTIDPETDEVVLYDIPTRNMAQSLAAWPLITGALVFLQEKFQFVTTIYDELFPVAYGIDVTPDGKIWFSLFNSRRIGNFDKATETFEMIDTPFGGPRRFRADSKGDLWIPAYTDGLVYKYNVSDKKFTPYELPTGRGDSSYALAVDPNDDSVWICGSNSDTMMNLKPDTGDIVTYRFPSKVTFCREISFSDDGSVWTSYSNYPSVSIEGGSSVFVRIKPNAVDSKPSIQSKKARL